ncbi:universal stress protein, partial [Streptomyces klenkii]
MFPDPAPNSLSTVTVGLDESDESLAAADWAAREALLRQLPLRLVHVRESNPYARPYGLFPEAGIEDGPLPSAAADLARRHPGLTVTTADLRGRPAAVLAGESPPDDLLVLGSRALGA